MACIFNCYRHRIIEHGGGMGKFYAMIPNIRHSLLSIPNDFHKIICILYVFVKCSFSDALGLLLILTWMARLLRRTLESIDILGEFEVGGYHKL